MKALKSKFGLPFFVFLLGGALWVSCSSDDDENDPTVPEAPSASFSAPTVAEVGNSIEFIDNSTDSDGAIVARAWSFGNGDVSADQSPVYTYTQEGTYEVSLTVTDDDGLTGTASSTIEVTAAETAVGLFNRTITHDGNAREYALYVPSSYTGDQEVPLVVYLHGAPENKELAQATTDFTEVSEAEGFIMVYAEAASGSTDSYTWADGRGSSADQAFNDSSFVNALTDAVTEEYAVNSAKRYLCGFSNGGFCIQHIAFQGNSRFAAMASVSASLHEPYESENPGRAIPMLYIYGTADQVLSYENGGFSPVGGFTVSSLDIESAVDYWVGINGCNTTPTETEITDADTSDNSTVTVFEYTGGTDGSEVKFYRVNGGGHTWPGVVDNSSRPSMFFGATNNDMKAGQEIWGFFNKFESN